MTASPSATEQPPGVNPVHAPLWHASLRAPSAHNAQPWYIHPLDDGHTYELHYDQHDDLPEDPDSKDAYLTMGAFVETMVLEAPNHDLDVEVTPVLTRDGQDLHIARVAVQGASQETLPDPLGSWVSRRATNRSRYTKEPLPPPLEADLRALGNTLVQPQILRDTVLEASMNAWGNPRYVRDLQAWLRKDEHAPDGLAAPLMQLGAASLLALDLVFKRGSLKSDFLKRLLSSSEVTMFGSAPKVAVLAAPDMSPPALFNAGRRLLRSWVSVNRAGYAYQPYSVAVDDATTIPKVAELTGVATPVALYRIGRPTKPPKYPSNRKPLAAVVKI